MIKNSFQRIGKNLKGKDYAVGDIHGSYTKLMKALDSIKFNKKFDRLFCVGDLCDRGEESEHVVSFLNNSWVYSVMGNHEQIIFLYEKGIVDKQFLINVGAKWWLSASADNKKNILKKFKQLPLVIELETEAGKVGILHAECPVSDWNNLEKSLYGANSISFIQKILWGMDSPQNGYIIKNINAVIVGHMTQKSYKVSGNCHLLDTGAVYPDGFFTILDISRLEPVHYFI